MAARPTKAPKPAPIFSAPFARRGMVEVADGFGGIGAPVPAGAPGVTVGVTTAGADGVGGEPGIGLTVTTGIV